MARCPRRRIAVLRACVRCVRGLRTRFRGGLSGELCGMRADDIRSCRDLRAQAGKYRLSAIARPRLSPFS